MASVNNSQGTRTVLAANLKILEEIKLVSRNEKGIGETFIRINLHKIVEVVICLGTNWYV